MEEIPSDYSAEKRCALVTGGNKGIGLEICRQLASNDHILVVLTARDEKKGIEAVESLKTSGLSNVVFHQLDVTDPSSIASLENFLKTHFKKLDILVNNAAEIGLTIEADAFRAFNGFINVSDENPDLIKGVLTQNYYKAEKCIEINYYGTKAVTEALLPFLQLSSSANIVNVSSIYGTLQFIHNDKVKEELNNVESLTEERLDELLQWFLEDFKENKLEANGWPIIVSAYKMSKIALNAYTRMLARKFPSMRINCVHPGYVKTDISCNTGFITAEEGAKGPVKVALLPDNGPSGQYFDQTELSTCAVVTGGNKGIGLEICRQLASNGILVILTARDEKRGIEAVQSLKATGLSDVVFHQLDVKDPSSIASFANFLKTDFKKLDILVNNAGEIGLTIEANAFKAVEGFVSVCDENPDLMKGIMEQNYDKAEKCIETNYYGTKAVTEALLPFLQLSNSANIVNVSSVYGTLQFIHSEKVKEELNNVESLTEEGLDKLLQRFLKDFKENKLEVNGWPILVSAYKMSKAAVNAYTRILARKFPNMRINSVHPGYVKTDITRGTGFLTVEEGAKGPVKVALLPKDGPSGQYFDQTELSNILNPVIVLKTQNIY
ncbi:Carbonyl reductase [NADPH] [Thalictrum thalictroides]|uniref:Carbonyl reductase [NADPH] n=1 Tax=Thalictrum thalictroides TaxID=46969 RepID=A0A7J6W2Y7_THATH|nr:Carbonyl reductase [NADPH] [Thalictrum thalictroides]